MSNRLREETSPYLLQHADNPVDWQPWDATALAQARETGKPILLSIGYSACHWCHVMAHESFEDPATAEVMNALYVNIKVDREERPDLDRIYQLAQQMFTGRAGGWPLTMFLTPDDHLPIFAGTYFPKQANYGMPAFADVLTRVESYYRTHRDEVGENGRRVLERFARLDDGPADGTALLDRAPIDRARERLGESFDAANGGFGTAPKFPHPGFVDLLLAYRQRSRLSGGNDAGAERIITGTLDAMAAGGLYDHIGGGFFRYCVDAHWGIPHFEKMLYDNAALLGTYADAAVATGESDYARIVRETATWLRREMRSPDGGYYATLDADADGEEGSYYILEPADLRALGDDAAFASRLLGLDGPPNFEGRAWHPQTRSRAAYREMSADDARRFADIRNTLLEQRGTRSRPGRDEKILTSWNGLMIAALARSSRRLGEPALAAEARAAADFIRASLWSDGRLFAVWKDGAARFPAYLDDYAFLLSGLIELLQADFDPAELAFATELADTTLELFADPDGGCFFTARDHEELIHRPKPIADEALPSGNGTLAVALSVLGHLLGEPRYLDAAAASVRAAWSSIERYPEAHATYLRALGFALEPPTLVIVRGDPDSLAAWRSVVDDRFRPATFAFLIDAAATGLPATLAAYPADAGPAAYVCVGTECSAPITTPAALGKLLATD